MHPETMRQQHGNQQATAVREQSGSQRPQTRASMTTEYQEQFLPPHCSTQKDPYHQLKGTSADKTTFRSFYVTQKSIKYPPKAPQPSLPPKGQRKCSSAPHNLARFAANQIASNVESYTSVYKNDFQAWKAKRRQPFKLSDSLKVNQGLVVLNGTSKEGHSQRYSVPAAVPHVPKPKPIESITSYKSDYVSHSVQPRPRSVKPVHQTKGLLIETAVPSKPKVAWDINQDLFDDASEFFQQFRKWTLENKLQGKAKESSPPVDPNDFLSTTHATYTAHKCPRTKPVLPAMQNRERSKEPFQATTTMMDDFRAWNTPRRLPIIRKEEMDWPKKPSFSLSTPEGCKTNQEPFSLLPKVSETALCYPQRPAKNGAFAGLECVSNGTEDSRMYWATSLGRGVKWADGGFCEEAPESHQMISSMVSSF